MLTLHKGEDSSRRVYYKKEDSPVWGIFEAANQVLAQLGTQTDVE